MLAALLADVTSFNNSKTLFSEMGNSSIFLSITIKETRDMQLVSRLYTLKRSPRYLISQRTYPALNVVDQLDITLRHHGDGLTSSSSTSSTTHTVNIVSGITRDIVVQNQQHTWNIKTTRNGNEIYSFKSVKHSHGSSTTCRLSS